MTPNSISSDVYVQAIAVNLSALRDRLREGLMRADAASEASADNQAEIAMGALFGMDTLLIEARALHHAALILHRTQYAEQRGRAARQPSEPYAPQQTDVANAHLEVDELAKLGVLTPERASLLKDRLTAEVIAEHVNAGMKISELIDMYNELAAVEAASSDESATEAALCSEFERYCAEQGLGERDDAVALLRRQDLTDDQRRWLSDFVRRWEAMRKRFAPRSR